MIALTSPYLWYSARATGTVALVLLTLTVALGTLVATRVGGRAVGRFELNEIHRSISTIALVFVAIHVIVTVIDSYVPTGIASVFIPLTSSYRRVPVAIGAVAVDLMLAVWISSMIKERIRYSTWRFVHWTSWGCFAAAVLHGFLTGTDRHQAWSIAVTLACLGVAALSLAWRVTQRPDRAAGRTAHSPIKGPTAAQMSAQGAVPPAVRRANERTGSTAVASRPAAPPPAPPRVRGPVPPPAPKRRSR